MVARSSKRISHRHADNHAFLHGRPTTVPGSWENGKTTCGQDDCDSMQNECATCVAARGKRALVASSSDDPRFNEERVITAPAIFPNNDIKYHVGKQRARKWCQQQGKGITWSRAQDVPKHKSYQRRPYLQKDQKDGKPTMTKIQQSYLECCH